MTRRGRFCVASLRGRSRQRCVPMRRGNLSRMYWPRFQALLLRFPIAPARIVHVRRYP